MTGNMPRWSTNSIPANDISSHYSATYSDISVDERIRNPDIGQRLHSLFQKQLYTDVKFVLSYGVKPKPTLMAHKAILSIGSNKFREMFYDKMSNALSDSSEIQINNVTSETFRNVIEYLYTDDVIFENDQIVVDTLSAATIFQVQPLVDKCESYIESVELTEDNVCTKFQMAVNKGLSSLKMRCTEFIQENTGAVLRSNDFLTLNPSIVRVICKLEKFNLRSEIELLNGIVYYVENRPEYKTNRRAGVETFLRHIRLLNVTCEEFNQFVQRKPNIFSAPEAANILMSLANPAYPAPNLPSWCKRGSNRCNFQRSNGPRGERVGYSNASRKLVIGLMPNKFAPVLHDLICLLEMKCTRGYHRLQGLKLSFDDPVYETSVINDCIINVEKQPGNFKFEEYVQIERSKDSIVRFSQRLLTKKGDRIVIRICAKGVKNYRFLQFDERNSFSKDSPFSCVVGSVPNDYKMFIIREVLYCDGPPPRKQHPIRKFGPC
ncbi:BTB/POZ domain-containing protein 6-B isoform X4 [Parasteatoda tepidariorum]|uniref:BTB/POZ domain-containing protein 6-B isoform X4 n=1 Tax=Parasteatoda tepidariorum TaxID=114398 RepID=UPI001C7225B6|nr:kelch-like protein 41b isoform X1 [Parasteatoda tepidariorum]